MVEIRFTYTEISIIESLLEKELDRLSKQYDLAPEGSPFKKMIDDKRDKIVGIYMLIELERECVDLCEEPKNTK